MDGERKNTTGSRTHRNPDLPSSTFNLHEASPKKGGADSPTADLPLQYPPTALRSIKSTGAQTRQQGTAGKRPKKRPTKSGALTHSPDPEIPDHIGPPPTPKEVRAR
jgi:hypothetical protein